MGSFLIILFTAILVIVSAFIVLVVLMQRPNANSGMGSALGGGAAESAFGAQTNNVLTRATIYGCAAFFVVTFGLYLGHMGTADKDNLPTESITEGIQAKAAAKAIEPEQAEDLTTDLSEALVAPEATITEKEAQVKAAEDSATAPQSEAVLEKATEAK